MQAYDANKFRDTDFAARAGDTYARLRDLFAAVSEISEDARAAWMNAHVPDPEERTALERLLAADLFESGYFETPADEHAARMAADEPLRPEGLIGQSIGAFRLTRLLGKGGMAAVFLGAREGADFEQRVAVKLLRRGLYSEIEQRLFRRERQLLAGLDHPNIARLIDGGVTSAGIPYLVIEYVDGDPITRHAGDRRLGVRERLNLFLIVCRAVEAAHRALIVHRDIKPSNILVATDGTVKLLDFGIAKLLEEDTESATVGVFTPDYAAPEQLTGAPITTATDVYALGVLLHELLLGVRPRGNPTRRPSSMAGADGSEHARLPKPELLARALRGDVDTILLKCLAAEPGRRYTSAGALADDIQRRLAGKPVEAHRPSRWYRASKFVQRHRGSVVITAALVLAVFAALALTLWQANVARHEAARAQEVQAFVESLFQPLQEQVTSDKTPSVLELLHRGLTRIDISFHDDLRAQAELIFMFARINDSIGEVKSNLELSERAWRLNERVYGPNDPRTLNARELHARVLADLNDDTQALAEFTAVRAAMEVAGIHGVQHARVIDDLSLVRMDQGARDDEIITDKQLALAEREYDPAATPDDLSSGYNNLGNAYDRARQWDQALNWYRKAYATDLKSRGESFASAVGLGNIGGILYWSGRWRESVATLEQARASYQHVAVDNHPNLVSLLIRLCDEQAQLELNDRAKTTCNDAVKMAGRVLGESHPTYAMALIRRAGAGISAGRFDAAGADLQRARDIYAKSDTDARGALRIADVTQAAMDRLRGDDASAREHLKTIIPGAANAESPSASRTFAWFALACIRAPGDGCTADQTQQAEKILASPAFTQHPNQLPGRTALAQIDLLHGDANKAIERIEKGLVIAVPELGEKHSWVGEAHLRLGDAQTALGDAVAAHGEYTAAAAILSTLPADHPLRVEVESRLAPKR
jgi:eukaryotic-like serine/threonine-protein kinase